MSGCYRKNITSGRSVCSAICRRPCRISPSSMSPSPSRARCCSGAAAEELLSGRSALAEALELLGSGEGALCSLARDGEGGIGGGLAQRLFHRRARSLVAREGPDE